MTLLEMVQSLLSSLEGDNVNSISDTQEALQVAQVVKDTYFSLISRRYWSFMEFTTVLDGEGSEALLGELRDHVAAKIGPIAKPASIVFTEDLPKTRSGKIMRRLLKDISEERKLGDVTTLANSDIVEAIRERARTAAPEE